MTMPPPGPPPAPPPTLPPRFVPSGGYRIDINRTPPHDRLVISRDRGRRWRWFLGTTSLATVGPLAITTFLGSLISLPTLGFVVGLPIAAYFAQNPIKQGIVRNGQQTGFVTQDEFWGEPVVYGPGLHPALYWESREKENIIPLRVIDAVFTISIPTRTALVTLEILLQWRPDLANLQNFLVVKDDEASINNGLQSFLDSFLNNMLTGRTAAQVRLMTNLINHSLEEEFMGRIDPTTGRDEVTAFEQAYGVQATTIRLRKIKVPDAVQQALDAGDEAGALMEIVAEFVGLTTDQLKEQLRTGTIPPDRFGQHLQQAMILSGNATFNVNRIDIPGLVDRIARS